MVGPLPADELAVPAQKSTERTSLWQEGRSYETRWLRRRSRVSVPFRLSPVPVCRGRMVRKFIGGSPYSDPLASPEEANLMAPSRRRPLHHAPRYRSGHIRLSTVLLVALI